MWAARHYRLHWNYAAVVLQYDVLYSKNWIKLLHLTKTQPTEKHGPCRIEFSYCKKKSSTTAEKIWWEACTAGRKVSGIYLGDTEMSFQDLT